MRVNSCTTADLMTKSGPVKQLAKFFAPVFVHETVHKEQAAWLDSKKFPAVFPQEDEVEAMSVEALYLIEKTKKDPEFTKMLSSGGPFSPYLKSEAGLEEKFRKDPREFRRSVKCEYYPYRESFEATVSKILLTTDLISYELQRRKNLSKEELAQLEKECLDEADAGEIPSEETIVMQKKAVLEKWRGYYLRWYKELRVRVEGQIDWAEKARAKIAAEKTEVTAKAVPLP